MSEQTPPPRTVAVPVPEYSLVALVGPTGSGKTSFAKKWFKETEVLSSDVLRRLVSDHEHVSATKDAFEVMRFVAGKRLARGLRTVLDATHIQPYSLDPVIELAKQYYATPVAIVFNMPTEVLLNRAATRTDRHVAPAVVFKHRDQLRRTIRVLRKQGFRHVYILSGEEQVNAVEMSFPANRHNRKTLPGPFDIIGDIHGCYDELVELLVRLGYRKELLTRPAPANIEGLSAEVICGEMAPREVYIHPEGRVPVFLGDYVDRGPYPELVLELVMTMSTTTHPGTGFPLAIALPGNHDLKMTKTLRVRSKATLNRPAKTMTAAEALASGKEFPHGLKGTLEVLSRIDEVQVGRWIHWLEGLTSHLVLDGGRLVVAHAGLKEAMIGRSGGAVRSFALYGETTGEKTEEGLPVRVDWARDYRGEAVIAYGHYYCDTPRWENNTICVNTNCCMGGSLTALRYPEKELVSVKAHRKYWEGPVVQTEGPSGPSETPVKAPEAVPDLLDIEDLVEKRSVQTELAGAVRWKPGEAAAALEQISRSAVDPRWLVYLPPTMSPCETAPEGVDLLERPLEAFEYFRSRGVEQVICEEKHMGSRMIAVVCKDDIASRRRFTGDRLGVCYSRLGRPFFGDQAVEAEVVARVRAAIGNANLWNEFQTDWLVLDCELMPWSAKAVELLKGQYASTGISGLNFLADASETLLKAEFRGLPVRDLSGKVIERGKAVTAYREAYRAYCWSTVGVDDLKLAPFHIMAGEGEVYAKTKDHNWHMRTAEDLTCVDDSHLLMNTTRRTVKLDDEGSVNSAVDWWFEHTGKGGEGMVVKPLTFIPPRGEKGLVQPALKVRGREYLRIIYGPEYVLPENLPRLRSRGLWRKRALAIQEFALGLEGLTRFVDGRPLREVHECAFGVLALECEAIDPRL
jgi:protein phosphatase